MQIQNKQINREAILAKYIGANRNDVEQREVDGAIIDKKYKDVWDVVSEYEYENNIDLLGKNYEKFVYVSPFGSKDVVYVGEVNVSDVK